MRVPAVCHRWSLWLCVSQRFRATEDLSGRSRCIAGETMGWLIVLDVRRLSLPFCHAWDTR